MVTKPEGLSVYFYIGSVLAKILMVTKQPENAEQEEFSSVLAKILMVTKLTLRDTFGMDGSVLAKILMVTKHSFHCFAYC